MKKLFFTLCAAVISMAAMAQDNFVATLTHDGNLTKTYYGEDALISAYDDAYEGDVITLSAGTFNCPTAIEKAIIIRGVGMETATETVNVTKLKSSSLVKWNIPENPVITPLLEGVSLLMNSFSFEGSEATSKASITKCRINYVNFKKGTFYLTHCIQNYSSNNRYRVLAENETGTFVCINNSIIGEISCYGNAITLVENSILRGYSFYNVTITNSILFDAFTFNASNILRYCIAAPPYNYDSSVDKLFQNLGAESSHNTSMVYSDLNSLFEDLSEYHLTETAAATYLGNDGTEVGIYGGSNPFNPIPTNPKVRKLVVDTTPGSNGKLNVNIEIE